MNSKTKIMMESALCVALSVVCGFIKIWQMPQGGSISLVMLPILLISFRRGWVAGIVTGAIYGLISLAIDGVVYHPLSILLDYCLAFGLIGIAGLFKKTYTGITLGTICGVFLRFISSVVSGALLFAEYAPEGQNPWIYSIIYQATYMVPELIICVALLIVLFSKAQKLFDV